MTDCLGFKAVVNKQSLDIYAINVSIKVFFRLC